MPVPGNPISHAARRALVILVAVGFWLQASTTAGAAPAAKPAAKPATQPARGADKSGAPAADPTARPATPARPAAAPPRRKATPRAQPPRKKARRRLPPPRADRPAARAPERRRPDLTERPRDASGDDKEPIEKKMRKLQGTAWAMVGVTAILLTITGVFALMAEDREDEMERMATQMVSTPRGSQPLPYEGTIKRDFEQYQKEGKRFSIVTYTFLGLSAASLVAATTLFIVDAVTKKKKKPEGSSLRLQPLIGPKGAGVSLGLEF